MARARWFVLCASALWLACSDSATPAANPDAGTDGGSDAVEAGPAEAGPPDVEVNVPDAGEVTAPALACSVQPCFQRVVGTGASAICALTTTGEVWCWGSDGKPDGFTPSPKGALGRGAPVNDPALEATPTRIPTLDSVVELSVGRDDVSCALRSDGSVWCWGVKPAFGFTNPPSRVANLAAAEHIAADFSLGCAVVASDRSLWCWGQSLVPDVFSNADGSPTRAWSGTRPVRGIGLGIKADLMGSLALLLDDGHIVSWGRIPGRPSSLKDGIDPTPAEIDAVSRGRWIGPYRFIADGRVWGWADSATDLVAHPFPVLDGDRVIEVGERIAVDADGTVFVWGNNTSGELGHLPDDLLVAESPIVVDLPAKARSVASAPGAFCASLVDGSIVCWGRNVEGQLGRRTRDGSAHPHPERIQP